MPRLVVLDLHKLDVEEVLVDLEDSGHDNGDGEVLLHEHIVKVKGLLDVLAVVVPRCLSAKRSREGGYEIPTGSPRCRTRHRRAGPSPCAPSPS